MYILSAEDTGGNYSAWVAPFFVVRFFCRWFGLRIYDIQLLPRDRLAGQSAPLNFCSQLLPVAFLLLVVPDELLKFLHQGLVVVTLVAFLAFRCVCLVLDGLKKCLKLFEILLGPLVERVFVALGALDANT